MDQVARVFLDSLFIIFLVCFVWILYALHIFGQVDMWGGGLVYFYIVVK